MPPSALVLANNHVQLSYTRASDQAPTEQLTDAIIDMVALNLWPATPDYCIWPALIVVSSLDAGSEIMLSYPIADFILSLMRKEHQDGLEN